MLQVLDAVHENKPANGIQSHSEASEGKCMIIVVRNIVFLILQQVFAFCLAYVHDTISDTYQTNL